MANKLTLFTNETNKEPNKQFGTIQIALLAIQAWANRIASDIQTLQTQGVVGATGATGATGAAGNTSINKWSNFSGRGTDGVCTLNGGTGITSITRNGAGIYDVVFSSAFANTNYGFSVTGNSNTTKVIAGSLYGAANKTVNGCTIAFYDIVGAGMFDPADATIVLYN